MEYSYNIINDVYNWMLCKKKTVEVRLLKEKSEAIQVGDFIVFNNQDNIDEFIRVKVLGKTLFKNVAELLNGYGVERIMPDHTEE